MLRTCQRRDHQY